jgi:hypothetical protein
MVASADGDGLVLMRQRCGSGGRGERRARCGLGGYDQGGEGKNGANRICQYPNTNPFHAASNLEEMPAHFFAVVHGPTQ